MFNYIRSEQLIKKPITKKPISPIEKKVNMPIDMQPIPQPITDITCIYPNMNMQPNMPPQQLPQSLPQSLPQPPAMPCIPYNMGQQQSMPCMYGNGMCPQPMPCMYCNMAMQLMPSPAIPPTHINIPHQDPSCDMSKTQDDMEVTYIKKMYPPLCQKIQNHIENELCQYDHDLSPIYEMYPASETIHYMANCIYTDMKANYSNLIKEFEGRLDTRSPMGGSFYTLVYVLLLNELYRKRMRNRLYR